MCIYVLERLLYKLPSTTCCNLCFVPILLNWLFKSAHNFSANSHSHSSYSSQLFIGQYHIWLAADTKGILVLLPNFPTLNLVVTTMILICVAHEVNRVTAAFASFLLGSPSQRETSMTRKKFYLRVIIFAGVLFLLAVMDSTSRSFGR